MLNDVSSECSTKNMVNLGTESPNRTLRPSMCGLENPFWLPMQHGSGISPVYYIQQRIKVKKTHLAHWNSMHLFIINHPHTLCLSPQCDPPMSSIDSLKILFLLGAGLLLDRGTEGPGGGFSGLTGPLLPLALT